MLFEKQIEKIYRGSLFVRNDNPHGIFYFAPEDFPGLQAHAYQFTAKAGHELKGWFYHYDDPKPGRLVVFDHGLGNGHRAYMREIERLAREGYLVYSYDHTGCNRSEGEHIHGLSGSLSDLDDCIRALVTERGFDERQISVVGHSWGGFSTLNILAYHPNLKSIVAMSGFISIPAMQKQAIPFILSLFGKGLFELEKSTNPGFAESNAIEVLSNTDRPVLVIHSVDDATVDYKSNFRALSRALGHKTNIEFMLVNGSGHSPQYTADAFAYKEQFFKDLKKLRRQGRLAKSEQKSAFIKGYDWLRMTEQNPDVWNKILGFLKL